MNYSVKAVRTFTSTEGAGFNATLCRDGKAVAEVIDDGCGGCVLFRWKDRAEEKVLDDHVKTLPSYEYPDIGPGVKLEATPDLFIGNLIDLYKFEKSLRNRCRSAIIFRLKTDPNGTARRIIPGRVLTTYKGAIEYIQKKHDGLIEVIYNEKFGCGCKAFRG